MARNDDIEELVSSMRQIFRTIHQKSGISVEERAATMLQRETLMFLKEHAEATMTDLSSGLGMSLSSATQLVERLVKVGFAKRRDDPIDRRIVRVSMTGEGNVELERLAKAKRQRFQKIFSVLPDSDIQELLRILKSIVQKLTSSSV